jgi:hypothetical protein
MRWGFKPYLIVGVVFVAIIAWSLHEKDSLAEKEKQLAIKACLADDPAGACLENIEKHHEACFDYNYTSGGQYSKAQLNQAGYRQCLMIGPDRWWAEKRRKEAKDRELARSLLE